MFEFLLRHINLIRGLTNIYARCQDWHNAHITPITTFTLGDSNRYLYTLYVYIYPSQFTRSSQEVTNKMSIFYFSMPLHLSDVIGLNEAWKRGHWEPSMRANLALGGEQQTRWQTEQSWELIRDIMSYSEQAGGKLVLWAHCALGGGITCNTWHDDTVPVWEGGLLYIFAVLLK